MGQATADKPMTAAEKKKAAKAESNGHGEPANIDLGPQNVHDGDPDETGEDVAQSASGAATQLSFAVGGKRPTTSGLRLVGGKLDIEQMFSKGEKVVLQIEAEIRAVEFVDQVDGATGQVIGSERRHKASIVGVSVV